jgi:CSLREA domain-containing protein
MGGGVFQFNTGSNQPFSISGSIVAGNTAGGSGADLVKDPQSTLTVNYSLIGTGITPTAGGNNVVTDAPQLGPLSNNGGPTQTHALLAGSPAIDAGDPSIVFNPAEFDQRGAPFVRVFDGDDAGGAQIDIGDYERQTLDPALFVVTTTADEFDYSNADVSLREAINSANGSVGPDTVTFAAALSGATITLGGTELAISEALVIDARPLAENVTIDANELSRIFHITATTGDVTLGGLTLTGGRTTASGSAGRGGAIRSLTTGTLTLDQSTVSGSITAGNGAYGGGIWSGGNLTLTESTVSGNSTAGSNARGGGIFSNSTVTLTESTVSGNSTAGSSAYGGGIFSSSTMTLTESTVSENSTAGDFAAGGGIFSVGTVTLTQSTASGNGTTGSSAYGGGIFSNSTVTLAESTVSENSTAGDGAYGGGIFSNVAVMLTQSTVSGNSTSESNARGGGIFSNGAVTLIETTVGGNSTSGLLAYGGGIFSSSTVTLTESTVSGNSTAGTAARGGGIRAQNAVTLTQSTVSGNSTAGDGADGGGIWAVGAVTLTQSTVSGNSTTGYAARGGGIRADGDVTLTQSTVSGNSTGGSNTWGGGIYTGRGAVTLTQSTVTDNHSGMGGGVLQGNYIGNPPFSISGSIVAGNTAGGGGPDVDKNIGSTLTVNYSLIGTGITPTAGGNNVVTDNPQLGLLGNNGGPTQTHALLPGSPAIDAGDPSFMGPPNFDQRGFAYSRVIGGRIDMGAFEFGAVSADFDEDGNVDGLDFLAWQRGFGIAAPNAAKADGDADNDTDVDGADLAFWELQYGTDPPPLAAAFSAPLAAVSNTSSTTAGQSFNRGDLVDLALTVELTSDVTVDDAPQSEDQPVPASNTSVNTSLHSVTALQASESADEGMLAEGLAEEEQSADAWLSDELLEHVFG